MENQSYYRIWENSGCNEEINDHYLVVNCAGCCVLPHPFATHNKSGRKDYYLLYICRGMMKVLVNGEMMDMCAGQFIIFPPECEYKYTRLGDEEVIYYWAHFTGYGARGLLENCKLYGKNIFNAGFNEQVIREFNNMFSEFIRRDYCFEAAAASHLISACINLSRSMTNLATSSDAVNPDRIYASIKFIHKNFNSNISLKQLAGIEHLSISRYRTLFKQYTGFSPKNYIIALRINRACELTVQTDLSLKEIAESVGYHDQLYFSRIFKARTGIAPNCYKKNYQNNA
ncbi:MAG TPA: AraC family transcriptional regulator [Clostridiales bacterium]|nr:AraC family transcriptional regulator [Clostridiales bacterium]